MPSESDRILADESTPRTHGTSNSLGSAHQRPAGIFAKYSDPEKVSILWKSSLVMTIIGFVLALTGLSLNRYDLNDEVDVTLKGIRVTIPSTAVSSTGIEIGTDGCEKGWKVNPTDSPLHSRYGMTYSELKDGGGDDAAAVFFLDDSARVIATTHMGDFDGIYTTAIVARIFSIVGVTLQGIALLWTLLLGATPSPFFFNRPLFGQTQRQHLTGAAYHLILMGSGLALFLSNTLMSTIMAPLLSRVANFSLDWCADSEFDTFSRGSNDLEYMKFLGVFIQTNADATGVTYVTFAVSMALIYFQVAVVTLIGIRQVKAQSRVHYHLPRSQELLLPWYAKIPSLRWSLGLLVVAVLATCTTSYSSRVRGFELNMFFYQSSFEEDSVSKSWSLEDILLDRIYKYVVDKSIVKFILTLWIPLIMILGFAAVDYIKYVSKAIQTIAILLLFSAVIGITTVPPTPAFVLQKPQCFSAPQVPPTFGQFFEISESCNDQIYSIYSVLIGVPFMMTYFFIRYGSVRRKNVAYILLFVLGLISQFIVISTRLQYTVDVYIGCIVTGAYCLAQAPAFKLLLRFGIVNPGLRYKRPIVLSDKINPLLDDILRRLELHFMAVDRVRPASRDELDVIRSELNHAKEAMAYAQEKSVDEIQARGASDTESSGSDRSSDAAPEELDDMETPFLTIDDTKKYN